MRKRGKIIVIEGTDGAGKGTQVEQILKKASAEKIPCTSFDFPRYKTPTGIGIKTYLHGYFGDASMLPPKISSGYYAVDRLAAKPEIEEVLDKGINAIMNRYNGSNLAHQAAKLKTWKARRAFIEWSKSYEYDVLQIAKPDFFVLLYVPSDVSAQSVVLRGLKQDDHERNADYQKEVVKTYLWLAKNEPDWRMVDCMKGYKRKSIEEVTDDIWKVVKPILLK